MRLTTSRIAELLNGQIEGKPDIMINKLVRIESGEPNALSFLDLPKYTPYLYQNPTEAVLVHRDLVLDQPTPATLIRVDNPRLGFQIMLTMFYSEKLANPSIHETAIIDPEAQIGKNVYIGPYSIINKGVCIADGVRIYPNCYIGDDTQIGNNTIIYPNTVIYHETVIGKNCVIHAGAIIGSDGFGFVEGEGGVFIKIPQVGNVLIENDVEIGSNTCIDRATLGSTIIRKGVKLDNQIQIGHNVEIDEHSAMAAQVGVSGSSRIGKFCKIGGQTGITGHLSIADKVSLGAQSGLSKSVIKSGDNWRGSPAQDLRKQLKQEVLQRQLPELFDRLQKLEHLVETLSRKEIVG